MDTTLCDPAGTQTQDLQNRNLTLYSTKLRSLVSGCKNIKKGDILLIYSPFFFSIRRIASK